MNTILENISKIGIVPVIALHDASDAKPLARALSKGGLPVAEVTFRTDAAEESIRIIANEFPDMLVGAGTVLTTEQADRAAAAGAKFIVSPGLNPKVVKHCIDRGIVISPGCATPSDIEQALEYDLEVVKFFPAEAAGGLNMIKAMAAPYTKIKFMPTGGINAGNLKSYLDFKKVIACGGSWMVNNAYIRAGEFDKIKKLTEEAVRTMLGFTLKSVGNPLLENLFGDCFSGTKDTITIQTNYIERAVYHLERQKNSFDMATAEYNTAGELISVYFNQNQADAKLRLVQK